MTGAFEQRVSTAKRNWAAALETYRTAVVAYRHLLVVRSQSLSLRQWEPSSAFGSAIEVRPKAAAVMTVKQPLGCLTPREREVAELIARGYSNQQIAGELVLTRGTVANHVAHVLAKLGATNRTQVAARVLSGSEHTHSEADPLMNEPQSALVAD